MDRTHFATETTFPSRLNCFWVKWNESISFLKYWLNTDYGVDFYWIFLKLLFYNSYYIIQWLIFCCFLWRIQAIPFLLELRSVLDWVCTQTTLTLNHWLKMEDIYANIFIMKCWRDSEKVTAMKNKTKYIILWHSLFSAPSLLVYRL